MPQSFVITGKIEISGSPDFLLGGRVEAYDRTLPSLEQRGKAPQLLGKSPIERENLQFRIEFTDEQFRQTGNGSSGLRQPTKINPNLSFKVFDATGREQTVTGIVPQDGGDPVQIVFNAPSNLEAITIQVAPIPEVAISKYEKLVALITPVIVTISLADLTNADVTFLVNQQGELFDGEPLKVQIEWLRRSALLAQQTNLPIEALYAWGRKIPITDSPNDLPSVLRGLLTREDIELSQTLQAAITENIISAQLSDRIPEILTQIERLRVNQGLLVARQFVGKLLNERTGEPLVGFRVQGFDLDAGDQRRDLGQAFSNDQGVFSLTYITPPIPTEATTEQRQRRLRLEVFINPQNQEKFEIEVQAGADQNVQDVRVTLPAPPETPIERLPGLSSIEPSPSFPTVARFAAASEPATSSGLIPFLQSQNINTLEALRSAGGIRQLENLPSDVDETQIELVETHTELYPLTNNVETSAALIDRGYNSLTQIARTSRSDFVNDLRDRSDFNAVELHTVARAQTAFLNNLRFRDAADRANGLETPFSMSENVRCTCQACESAVSPLAYLADLLKFATTDGNIKKFDPENPAAPATPITATDLTKILYQPFDKLRASCEAVDTPVRQVRLCIEVLRDYLKAKPPADPTKLATAEKQYLLAAYTSLLTKLGTSFSEIRLARNSEPASRKSLADRLGIDISHVNALFLDPNATDSKPLTEAKLEELLGLVDTTRNPLSEGVKLGDTQNQITTWNLNNVQPGANADQEGKVYVKLTRSASTQDPTTNVVQIELYRNKPLQDGSFEATNLVASGEISTDNGTVKLLPENKSGLYGVFDITYTADSNLISIAAVPEFINWRLQHLRTLWKAQDWTTDAYEETQSAVSLKQLPANITLTSPGNTFPPPLEAISYDRDRQRLIRSTGVMIPEERQRLLALSLDKDFQQAVEQLFQVSQRLPQSAVTLKQLLASITTSTSTVFTFASPLEAISYDRDRQQLIRSAGAMTTTERERLLSLAAIAPEESGNDREIKRQFQEAVKQLFQVSQRLPIIDPDLVGPDDFRNSTQNDPVFKLWQKRSEWVISRLEALAALPKTQNGAPSITELFTDMSKTVYYSINDSLVSIIAWSTTTFADLTALRNQLNEGDVAKVKLRLQDEFNLTVESFTRLMAIAEKANIWESNPQSEEEVSEEEWQEVYSILVQVLKMKLFATWRQEEKDAQIQLGPESFWLSLTQPQERDWPQTLSTTEPTINPSMLKLKDLPDAVVGEQAIKLWNDRQKALAQIPSDLEKKLKDSNGFDSTSGFDLVIKEAIGDASLDLERIQNELSNLTTVDEAIIEINSLINSSSLTGALTVESFKRLLNIRKKVGTSNKATRAEWAEIYTILAKPYKIKVLYPTWKEQETPGGTRLSYWQLLKAKLPRWRASNEGRQAWLQALLDRSQPPLIDPDLIDPGDLKNSFEGSAFAIWKRRETAITEKLESLNTRPKDLAGLEQRFQDTLGISKDDFLKVAETQARGEIIADRLVQLSLEFAEFNYLLRIVRLLEQNQTVLASEWENIDSILVQVWKRRQAAKWRSEEREEGVFRSPDFFQIQFQDTPANSLGEADPKEIWRSPKLIYLDWQEQLQTRIDQEQQTIQAYREAISAAEEETLEQLRDALVSAIDVQGGLEAKAKWVTENLLIDAKTSSSITTTRVAQAIETLQTLFLALRTGRSEEQFKDLELSQEIYDKASKVLGSYTSWRAAMFVFLYPENILQPGLRGLQTPTFQTLVNKTQSNLEFDLNDVKQAIDEYSVYFRDIRFLTVEASCLYNELGESALLYMFGRGFTNSIYWSVYDTNNKSGFAQELWLPIEADTGISIKNWNNIVKILGAIPYKSSIFLFAQKSNYTVIYAEYNINNKKWNSEAKDLNLDIPGVTGGTQIQVVVKQRNYNEPPHLAFLINSTIYERRLNSQGTDWEEGGFRIFTPSSSVPITSNTILLAMVTDLNDTVYIIRTSATGFIIDRCYPFNTNNGLASITYNRNDGSYQGAFFCPRTDNLYIFVEFNGSTQLLRLNDFGFFPVSSPLTGPATNPTSGSVYFSVPTSSFEPLSQNAPKHFVYLKYDKIDNVIGLPFVEDLQPYVSYIDTDNLDLIFIRPPFLAKPVVSPSVVDIPIQLTNELERRAAIQKSFEVSLAGLEVNLTYLQEAFYFVPIQLGIALQRSGEYLAALDLFRTVYDYIIEEDKRKIYYGLTREESLELTYERSQDWLLAPLNPHLIAATRQNTYTRFTLFAVIRCLLEFADAEFTQDTGESNARARSLYLTAQELLESKELKQTIPGCDEVVGFLDDVEPDDPRWRSAFLALRERVNSLSDLQIRRRVVSEIQSALRTTDPIEQRFANARAILDRATAELTPTPTLTQVIEQTESTNHQMQRTLMLDAAIQPALENLRLTARAATDPTSQIPPDFIPLLVTAFCIPVNPLLQSLRLRTETSLKKLRTGLNIAGLKRQLEPYSAPADTTSSLPTIDAERQLVSPVATINLQPTLYRYQVLIERAKQLVQLAAQVEAGYLSAEAGFLGAKAGGLGAIAGVQSDEEQREDKRFEKGYSILKAQQDLGLAEAGIKLQDLRLTEANADVDLASYQKYKSLRQRDIYQSLISSEENLFELRLIDNYEKLYESNFFIAYESQILEKHREEYPTKNALTAIKNKYYSAISANEAEFNIAVNSFYASFERRKQEWDLQRQFVELDIAISDNQIKVTKARVGIVGQEKFIAQLQATNAQDIVKYLEGRIIENPKLTNTLKLTVEQFQLTAELYDYIRNVLQGVYRYFLQQATAIAKLAENQLAFERQEVPPTYIQSDYWSVPINDTTNSNPNTATPDRRGLTGSARLLQDVYQLDQYAFTTNKRKLQLTKTFSLASLAPVEFQQFRETGVILFSTPMELFDRDFPGHYLRLIRRVRTSVIALIPPTQGIKATLSTVGITRVVVGPDVFQTIPIRRDPEFVALSSPTNATGLFELESLQPDFLVPFEGNGVDSSWEFRMPKAANQFDYRTIADVLITIEYTALNSNDYRQQVIQTLNPNLSSDRPFSFRNHFADQWYDLNNPEQIKTPMKVKFQTFREDFPPNVETLKIQQVLLYFVRASEKTFEIPTTELRFTERVNQGTVGGSATAIDGIISTRRGNAGSWTAMISKSPVGEWELTLPNTEEVKKHFQDEEIDDILFVITYAGRTPEWPA
ncbi:hypothetical protein A6770_35085 [Nostoc minutum NIES-26]|uniref:Uncharacterized protein n=1 Tax=Nostoc minutum NIES-26 TaxID=1844469 RepID=A0A367S2W4_9NOSO|nr:hypothetical protein A6770_35085 [Nostoc minutum NIES-26]